jgi:hypothetical protein
MQNYKTAIGMALFFAAAGLERINKTSKLYQFRLDDSAPAQNACCRHAERFVW